MPCLVKDHRGNGKVERLIRTINERLRASKEVFLAKDYTGLSDILFALRTAKKADGKSPFEMQFGRKPNTVESNLIGDYLAEAKTMKDLWWTGKN